MHVKIYCFIIYYLLSNPPCPEETYSELSMLSRYVLYHQLSRFCKDACHCELCLCLIVLGCLDFCYIVCSFMIKCMLGDILFKLTIDVLWYRSRSGLGTHPKSSTWLWLVFLLGMPFFWNHLAYLGIYN